MVYTSDLVLGAGILIHVIKSESLCEHWIALSENHNTVILIFHKTGQSKTWGTKHFLKKTLEIISPSSSVAICELSKKDIKFHMLSL